MMTKPISPLPFFGRYQELQSLGNFYQRKGRHRAGFLVLYGRKGVGKTRLLKQFVREQAITDAFYWQAPVGDAAIQLQSLSQALLRYAPEQVTSSAPGSSFYDWREALDFLAQIAEQSGKPKLFILEGFTDLCHQSIGLSSTFQHAWDHRLQKISNLRLIIAGSHVSTMIREVFAYSAPLYFRADANLFLRPLQYTDVLDMFPDRTPEGRLAIYAVTGGLPAYLLYFAETSDIRLAVTNLCLAPDSSFLSDMELLFDERLEEPELCREILTAVANGNSDTNSLSQQTGIPVVDLEKPLFSLRLVKLIEERHSVHDQGPRRHVRYAIANPALSFYLQYLKPALDDGAPGTSEIVEAIAAAYTSLHQSLGKEPFGALCREWIWAAMITKQLDMMPDQVGAYWNTLAQIPEYPVAAIDSREKKLLVGDLFWESGDLTTAVLAETVHKCRLLSQAQGDEWSVTPFIFGRRPFTKETQVDARAAGVQLVTLAEIEPLLLTARRQRRWELDNPQPVEIEF